MTDLLDLLSAFGTCNEIPWSCGDPLEYQGYDYETVQIGEQCWFAENLRAASYANGETILSGLPEEDWSSTDSGAIAVYGEGEGLCYTFVPGADACDELWSGQEFGVLYNWHAVADERGVCPTGWHVPQNDEWDGLSIHAGGDDVSGHQLKSSQGWFGDGNGSNASGFAGKPGGARSGDGHFGSAGYEGNGGVQRLTRHLMHG